MGIAEVGGPVEASEESWDRVNDVNLKSAFLTCKHAIPHMQAQGEGAIVNVSSISGERWLGVPYISYSTTKAALTHMTRIIARQAEPGCASARRSSEYQAVTWATGNAAASAMLISAGIGTAWYAGTTSSVA